MFCLIKQMIIALLSFSRFSTTKFMSLNNELCIARPTLIDLNPAELNYYLFMDSLDRCHGSSNTVNDLFAKICSKYDKRCKY